MVPDGYGLAYGISNDHIRWTITNLKDQRSGAELRHYLAESATEVRQMMENAAKVAASSEKVIENGEKVKAKL